jgi:hypothetical protein
MINAAGVSLVLCTDSVDDAYNYIVKQLTKGAIRKPGPTL